VIAAGVVLAAGLASFLVSAGNASAAAAPVERILIVSLPNVGWADLDLDTLPNLRTLFDHSVLADLSGAGVDDHAQFADTYTTFGAGARAESRPGNGECTDARPTDSAITCPGMRRVARHNDALLFDAQAGLLGDSLASAGIGRAVIADTRAADSGVALALADSAGSVPGGSLSRPVSADVLDEWRDRSVLLVEFSELARLEKRRDELPPAEFAQRQAAILRSVDEFVGGVSARAAEGDVILVTGTGQRYGAPRTTMVSLRAPGLDPGIARSAFTRRGGAVAIVDIGPTILDQFGIERPDRMEGRAIERAYRGGDVDERVRSLIDLNDAARFRDSINAWMGGVLLALQLVLAGLAVLVVRLGRGRPLIEYAALTMLGVLPATWLARLLPFHDWGHGVYWLFVVGVALVLATIVSLVTDRDDVAAMLVMLACTSGVIAVDVVSGARLQLNSALGYSPSLGGRFAGLGNSGYAVLGASTVLLAGLVAYRYRDRGGTTIAIVLMGLAIVVDGAPFFGSEVGGVLSMVPAFGVTAALLRGARLRWRLVLGWAAAAVAALALVAAVDLSRPAEHRTHLGRLLTGTGEGGWIVIQRKIDANLSVLVTNLFTPLLPALFLAVGYLVYRAPGPLRAPRRVPELNAAMIGLALLAIVGTVVNDSGISVAGVMLGVFAPVMIFLALRLDRIGTRAVAEASPSP
jgi:hypothetical protein